MKNIKIVLSIFSVLVFGYLFINITNAAGGSATATVTVTVVNPDIIKPDLKVTIADHYVDVPNSDGPVFISYDPVDGPTAYPFKLSWDVVANATACTLDGVNASINGGIAHKYVSTWTNNTKEFILSCTGANNISGSDKVVLTYPTVNSLKTSCNESETLATINWSAPAGFDAFYTRAKSLTRNDYTIDPKDGTTALYHDDVKVKTDSFAVHAKEIFDYWIHSKAPNGAFGPAVHGKLTVIYPCDERTGTWTYATSCPVDCPSAASTITQTCTGGNGLCYGDPLTTECKAKTICTEKTGEPDTLKVVAKRANSSLEITKDTKIPYNSKVVISWAPAVEADNCKCSSSDSLGVNNGNCTPPAPEPTTTSPFNSSGLKRNTTYNVSCFNGLTEISKGSVDILVDKIQTNYIER